MGFVSVFAVNLGASCSENGLGWASCVELCVPVMSVIFRVNREYILALHTLSLIVIVYDRRSDRIGPMCVCVTENTLEITRFILS